MVAVFDHLPVKEGKARQMIERFANSRGHKQIVPSSVSMEVLLSL
jgi:heme-degrading monooxygenase HmoA